MIGLASVTDLSPAVGLAATTGAGGSDVPSGGLFFSNGVRVIALTAAE